MTNNTATTSLTPEQQALLAQLADIELPLAPGFWPPSFTVLAGLGVLLLLICCAGAYLYTRHQRLRAKRYALSELKRLEKQDKSTEYIHDINCLLKRVCFTLQPEMRHTINNLWGHSFYEKLLDYVKPKHRQPIQEQYEKHFKQWGHAYYATDDVNSELNNKLHHYAQKCIHSMNDTRNHSLFSKNILKDFLKQLFKRFTSVGYSRT